MACGMVYCMTPSRHQYQWYLCLYLKSSVAVSEAGVSRVCSGRGSFHRKIQVKSSPVPVLWYWRLCAVGEWGLRRV
jgi:hypothetical protein